MGLGLYVARLMLREVHGDIWAESDGEGKGSTFFVKLPIEGSASALRAGTKLTVGIKAAEAEGERRGENGRGFRSQPGTFQRMTRRAWRAVSSSKNRRSVLLLGGSGTR